MYRQFGFRALTRLAVFAVLCSLVTGDLSALTHKKKRRSRASTQAAVVTPAVHRVRHRRVHYNPWSEPTYADSTVGDNVDGEDLGVRRAAVDALGSFNGSVVVVDPTSGRILTMVNQRLALGSGFQPCSTIKVAVALAALQEKLIERTSKVR